MAESVPGRTGWPAEALVLVVEDDPLISLNLVQMLEMLDFKAKAMPRAEAALEWISAGATPGLLLTDLRLPGMNGLALGLHARQTLPGLPVLLTTGQDAPELPDGLAQGSGFLAKPYTMRQLEAALRDLLPDQTRT